MCEIIVVGGGLAGAAFVLHLLRDHDPACRVTVIEPAAVLGAGLAYGTTDPVCRVNVAASRMSLFSETPGHFDSWLRLAGMPAADPDGVLPDGRLYPRRALYGQYVDETLRRVTGSARARLRHIRHRAAAAKPLPDGRFSVRLAGGEEVTADILVLAVSHTAPDLPRVLLPLAGDPRLVADPWRPGALASVPQAGRVLVIGTGLTGCDVIASLQARDPGRPITAVSRRGLLPRPRTLLPVAPFGGFDDTPATSALALLRRVRAAVAAASALGRPWEDVIDALRVQARVVWGALPVAERRRLLRHARPFWDAHRFQSAPQIDAVIHAAVARGTLEVMAATPQAIGATPSSLTVVMHPRGAPAERQVVREVVGIVNCTGPGHRSVVARNSVLHALQRVGALEPDAMALGIAVDQQSRAVRADGTAWSNLFVVGPLARGTHGELMGLPQMSAQPRDVAAQVARMLSSVGRAGRPSVDHGQGAASLID